MLAEIFDGLAEIFDVLAEIFDVLVEIFDVLVEMFEVFPVIDVELAAMLAALAVVNEST